MARAQTTHPWERLPDVTVAASGPFAVGSILWRDARGQLMCTVVAKATYELVPGESAPADVPLPIQEDDVHWDDEPSRSVHVPSDLAPFKSAAEVVVVGSAFAPGERAARSVVARVLVASVDKAVECFPPRRFRLDGSVDDATPLVRFSLRYEHAAGGPGTDNPAGIDVTRGDVRGRRPIPPLLPPSFALGAPGEHVPIAGLGPIASAWPSRAAGLGPHDLAWLQRPASSPQPATLSARYFQAAPADQWLDRPLVANERIVLENLHARHPRLVTSLSGLAPRALVAGPAREPIRLLGDLLFIDTDRKLCTLTFRGQIPVGERTARLRVLVAGVPMGADLSPDAARQLLDAAGLGGDDPGEDLPIQPDEVAVTTTQMPTAWAFKRPALPFAQGAPAAPPPRSSFADGALPFRETTSPVETQPAPLTAALPSIEPFSPAPPAALAAPAPVVPAPVPPAPVVMPSPAPIVMPSPAPIVMPPPAAVVVPPAPVLVPPPVRAEPLVPLVRPEPLMSLARPEPSPPAVRPEPSAPPPEPSKPSSFDASFGKPAFDAAFGKPAEKPAAASKPSSFDAAFGKSSAKPAGGGPKPASFDKAFGGLKAASDAAADQERAREAAPPPGEGKPAEPVLRRLWVLDLLSFDAKLAPRLRGLKRFAPALAQATRQRALQSVDAPRSDAPSADRDRADVLRVLSYARPEGAAAARRALADSLDDALDLEPPIVLLAGELRPTFEEVEMLRTTVAVAQPVAGNDKKLLGAIAVAQEALGAAVAPRPDAVLGFARQIEQASLSLSLPPRYVAMEVERLLLEGRKYKRRPLLGEPRVRAELTASGGGEVLTVYLPDAVATSLPLLAAFPVVLIAAVRPREDMSEPQEEALFVQALGRVLHARAEG